MRRLAAVLAIVGGSLLGIAAWNLLTGAAASTINTGPDRLRTFSIARGHAGERVLCTLGQPVPPVVGTLDGEAGAPDPVWLVAPDGRRLIVVWPAGFGVRFKPTVQLLSDRGAVVAQRGDSVELGVRTTDATGTHDNPYVAAGMEFGSCYPYAPASAPPPG